jgi:hypothetical protein
LKLLIEILLALHYSHLFAKEHFTQEISQFKHNSDSKSSYFPRGQIQFGKFILSPKHSVQELFY